MSDENAWNTFTAGTTPSTVGIHPFLHRHLFPGARVLDIGCAWGRTTLELAACGYRVTGVDVNEAEIGHARARSHEAPLEHRPDYVVADACSLPFPDASFDACVAQSFLTTITDEHLRNAALSEARRVLSSDGIAYFGVFGRSDDNPVYRERYDRDFSSTGTYGTFYVTGDGTPSGKVLYAAHHYSRHEIIKLLGRHFCIRSFINTMFPSYHGNEATGYVILATRE